MKNRAIQPSGVERVLREDDFIVSKTDPQGRITYGNDTFLEFSGYAEAELIGVQHNIIRHPDMPRAVFQLLWDTLRAGNECFAYVKNLAKDGSHYWVFANVTPSRDMHGQVNGYLSVRRKPRSSGVKTASELYRAMLEAERRAGPRDAIAAGTGVLESLLREKGLTYEELVLTI